MGGCENLLTEDVFLKLTLKISDIYSVFVFCLFSKMTFVLIILMNECDCKDCNCNQFRKTYTYNPYNYIYRFYVFGAERKVCIKFIYINI